MKKLASALSSMLLLSILINGCAKTEKAADTAQVKQQPKADMLLGDDGNIDDKRLAEARHINIAIDKTGLVIFQGIPGPNGTVSDHRLSQKESKEVLEEIRKANQGGDKEKLTALIQSHVSRIQAGQ